MTQALEDGATRPVPRLHFTTFQAPARWTSQGRFDAWTWLEVLHHVRTPELWPSSGSIAESAAQLPGWSFARFRDDARVVSRDPAIEERETAARVREVYGLAIEYVDDPAVDAEHIEAWWGRWQFVAYTTAWHQQPMGEKPAGPRWRVLIPFTRATSREEAAAVGRWARRGHREVGIVDERTEVPGRCYPVPSVVPGGYRWAVNHGEFIDPDRALADLRRWQSEEQTREARERLTHSSLAEVGRRWLAGWDAPTNTWVDAEEPEPPPPGAVLPVERTQPRKGWPRLVALAGRVWPGRSYALVGPRSSGRTALALQVAESTARHGTPVLLATTSTSDAEVIARLLSLRARGAVGPADLLSRRVPRDEAARAVDHLASDCPNLHLWSPSHGERTPEALAHAARAMAHSHGGRPPLVVLDAIPGPAEAPAWWETLEDVARPGGLGEEWPGAALLVVTALPAGAADAFADPSALTAWNEQAATRATALEELDGDLGRLTDAVSVLVGLTVAPGEDGERRDAAISVLANHHGPRGVVPFRFDAPSGRFEEV